MPNHILIASEIERTLTRLYGRIRDRFPDARLGDTCQTLTEFCAASGDTVAWISRPDYRLRVITGTLITILVLITTVSICQLEFRSAGFEISGFVQMIDAMLEGLAYTGAGLIFLVTVETRRKRKRVVEAINRLRSLAHIIDAHQLTKDPDAYANPTSHSPERTMSLPELGRYLDYCSEMLSLVGKIGFLYVQNFPDPVATDAVNDLENLTSGISQKIWQKILLVNMLSTASPRPL